MRGLQNSPGAWLDLAAFWLPLMSLNAAGSRQNFDIAAFDRFMEGHLRNTGIPGISVAIVDGSSVTLLRGYGRDGSGAPMTAHTPMYVGSLSKSMTALAVMQLVEKGQVQLDLAVQRYLPEFQLADPRCTRITVRELLNQSSGMADETYFEWLLPAPRSLRAAMLAMRSAGLASAPGSTFSYHNPNYEVAARLVEVVSGQSFSAYLRDNVFVPLGMSDSFTVDRLDDTERSIPQGHVFVFGTAVRLSDPAFFLNGAGGVVSSAADMGQWLLFNNRGGLAANGHRLLSEANMRFMHKASAPDGRYAFGWVDGTAEHPSRIYHAGWTPTFTSFQSLSIDGHHSVAILSNGGRTLLRGSGASYVDLAVQAVEHGASPRSFGESTRNLDIVLCIAAFLMIAAASRAVLRNRSWAERALCGRPWSFILQLVLWGIPLAAVVALPKIAGEAM